MESLLNELVLAAGPVIDIEYCALLLFDPDKHMINIRAMQGLSDKWLEFDFHLGESITGYTLANKKVQSIEDIASDPRRKYGDVDLEVKSMLSIPSTTPL